MVYEEYWANRQKQLMTKYDRWRAVAKVLKLSREALCRLEWIIFYQSKNQNVTLVCRHFGIGRSTFYKWLNKFNDTNLRTLETMSRRPNSVRAREAEPRKDERVITLRKQYPYFGKKKLVALYQAQYSEAITD